MIDHQTEVIALLGLAGTLLATVITTTWKSASLTTKLVLATERYERDRAELNAKTEAIEKIPDHERRIGMLEQNMSLIPPLKERVLVVEQHVGFSKQIREQKAAAQAISEAMTKAARASRPEFEPNDDEEG